MQRKLLLIPILLLALFLRFYRLESVPPALSQDETSIGYNAYSILKTGRDEHGVFLPINFQAFGEYKLPGYIYATVGSIALFGPTVLAVRFVSALSGTLTVLFGYLFVVELFGYGLRLQAGKAGITGSKKNEPAPQIPRLCRYLPLLSALLLVINPWHLHFSRGAYEVTLALFFLTGGVFMYLKGLRTNATVNLAGSIIFLGFSMYTYNINRAFIPLFGVILLFYGRKRLLSLTAAQTLLLIVVLGAVLFPYLAAFLSPGGLPSARGTLIFTSAAVQAPLLEFRQYFMGLPPSISKILFNSYVLTVWQYFNNIASYLSPSFFFITGAPHGNHTIGTTGYFYLFELPLIILGIIRLFDKHRPALGILASWIGFTVLLAAATREVPQATRSFGLVLPVSILSASGLWHLIDSTKRHRLFQLLFLPILTIALYQVSLYFLSYHIRFPVAYAKPFRTADRELSLYLRSVENGYDRIIIDPDAGFMYTSYLFWNAYDPASFQSSTVWSRADSEGFSFPVSFGKLQFEKPVWTQSILGDRILNVTSADRRPPHIPALAVFSYPVRPVTFAVKEKIISYPVSDSGYVAAGTSPE